MTQANNQGVLTGSFNIPAKVRVGTKSVVFVGENSANAQTTYTGSGTITTRELRNVVNITTIRMDPLAQTFTLTEPRLLAGVDLWFTQKGTLPVRVQIRETDTGLPNQTILSEVIKNSSELKTDGTHTEFRFPPISAIAGVEYAIVVLTDDAKHKVRVAELGKYDKQRGWVRRQPYQVGVLLSSSNAVSWTPHQDMDLTFRLLAARFTQTSRIIDCGTITAGNTTDLMSMASVDRTSTETDVRFVVKKAATATQLEKRYEVQDDQVLNLEERLSGEMQVEAHLSGTDKFSPVLMPNPQLALGNLQETATYFTRSMPCGAAGTKLKVCLEGLFSGTSGVDVYRETATADQWKQMTSPTSEPAGDGWMEWTYQEADLNQTNIRIKLVLKGNPKDRPRIRNLRVITT